MIEPLEAEDRRSEQARVDAVAASAASASAAASDAGVLLVTRPGADERKVVDVNGAQKLRFDFTLADVTVSIADVDVILTFANGGRITMPSFVLSMIAADPPKLFLKAIEIDPQTLIASAGEIRLVDQLPQMTVSDNIKPQDQPPPAPTQAPGVQLTANQSFANTPTPRTRAIPQPDSADQEAVATFARQQRASAAEEGGIGARSGGALTERSDRTANSVQQDRNLPNEAPPEEEPEQEPEEEPEEEPEAVSASDNAPVFTSDGGGDQADRAIDENIAAVAVLTATDADPDSRLTFSIVGGADASRFAVNSTDGTLYFVSPPDFEAHDSRAGGSVYQVEVEVSDGVWIDRQTLAITVQDANERPTDATLSQGAVAENGANGVVVGTVNGVDPDAGDSLSYAFAPDGDASGRFAIDAATGVISVARSELLDFEAADRQLVVVRITDQAGLSIDRALIINVLDANDAPVITSNGGGASAAVAMTENAIVVTTVLAADEDAGSVVSFAIVGGADASQFTINAVTGVLSFAGARDFENPTDSNLDNTYHVVVQASDGLGGADIQSLTVTVGNINDAPNAVVLSANSVQENAANGTLIGVASGSDPDAGAVLTYSLAPGGDAAGRFVIDPVSGELRVADGSRLDFEAAQSHVVIIRTTDEQGLFLDTAFTVTVGNVNEAPVITAFGGGATASISMVENIASVGTITAADPENAPVSYAIVGGADAAAFTINPVTGVLSFTAAPDFEAPADGDLDNVYHVVVEVSDGGLTTTQALAITVTNTGEPPIITSNGGGASGSVSLTEGQTAVTTVTATDADFGATLSYSIFGGVDASRFVIDSVTGVLSLVTAADFENPTDSDANNVYQVTVQVSDGSLIDRQNLTVTVLNINDAPVITSDGGGAAAFVTVTENSLTVTTVTAVDPDIGSNLIYTITGGADAGSFTINSITGELRFITQPNHEAPDDAGADNIYNVQVQVLDGLGGVDVQDLAVSVINQNEAPVITSDGGGAAAALTRAENGLSVTTVVASDVDAGATITYVIAGGADAGRFVINAATGELSFAAAPDFDIAGDADGNNIYEVVVEARDGQGGSDAQTLSVTLTNVNEAPVITSNGGGAAAGVVFAENGVVVTTVVAADADAATTLTYTITGGADAAAFTINPTTGVLTFVAAPNFETPTDVGGDNVYDVVVQVSDGLGGLDTQAIAVTVTNANDAPVITSGGGGATASLSVAENGTAVMTVTATDVDVGNTLTYTIAGGADAALFTINATTGVLTFLSGRNFEAPADVGANNIYDVRVQVSDGAGGLDTQDIAVTISNVNEAPTITSNGAGATATINRQENGTSVTTVAATDPDAGATRTFAIIGGTDAARFTINASTGVLTFVAAPNYEAPSDSDLNNSYIVNVQVSDGLGGIDTQLITVNVTNQNEAPVISSNGGGATAAISLGENGAAVTTVTATDVDAATTLTYSISGGADAALFTINATTGVLTFITAPSFEAPGDAGADNVYDVTVRVSDGALFDQQAIAVTITNVAEAPVITSDGGAATASINVIENTLAVTTVTATDQDVPSTLTYSIVGGADAARFTINSATGALSFVSMPDFDAPTDVGADNVYNVIVQVSDGALTDTQTIAVTVTNQNEAPVITSNGGGPTAVLGIGENTTAVTTVTASDPDAGAILTYTIIGGADAGRFTINATTGALGFVTPPDFESPTDAGADNVYDVIVQVSDGVQTDSQAITVTVTNSNDNTPVISSNGGGVSAAVTVAENSASVTTVVATDADVGATITYAIVGGADAGRFTINATTGALAFVAAPNFESPTDAGADNVYDVIVQASDGTFTDSQAIAVTVGDVNDVAPAITSNGGAPTASITLAENVGAVTMVTAADVDTVGTLTYTIIGGADAGRFTINTTTGALSFITPPDFESPTDAGGDNVYDVVVQVSDGVQSDSQAIAVTITNVNESAPQITSNGGSATAAISVAENGTAVTTVAATDADAGATITYAIVGGADAARFSINASTGALTFLAAPNFESPTDAGTDNVYDVIVRASDGALFDDQAIAVTVTDQNDVAPVISSNGGGATAAISMAENGMAVTTVTATDADTVGTLTFSITGGADAGRFTINATTGVLTFLAATDFEAPTDAGGDNIYNVVIRVSDGAQFDDQALDVTITNVNESAPVIGSNGGAATAAITVAENGAAVTTVIATDADAGATITYAIVGGADAARFTINATTGALAFVAAPNFESPTDAGADNVYDVIVQASDGTFTDSQAIAVTVGDVNDVAPAITSNGGAPTASITLAENVGAVTTVTAADIDTVGTLTYTIIGGADAGRFTINTTTGALSFVTPPDFESPTDAGGDNVYDVVVQVSDGVQSDSQAIAVTITNVNESAPQITSNGGSATAAISVAENGTAVTMVAATDADAGATITYAIVGGADAARFSINASTGALTFLAAPNFESPTDAGADNTYDVIVQASDGTFTDSQSIAVTVTNQNEAPTGVTVTASTPHNYVQNGSFEQLGAVAGGDLANGGFVTTTTIPGWTLVGAVESPETVLPASLVASDGAAALDTNAGTSATNISQTIAGLQAGQTYTLSFDVAASVVDGDTLTVRFGGQIVAVYNEASGWSTQSVTITGGQGDGSNQLEFSATTGTAQGNGVFLDNIRITNDAILSVAENAANGTTVGTAAGVDPDAGATFTYSLQDNAGGRFAINSATGVITVANGALLDFETATSYTITIRVTDQGGLSRDEVRTVTVSNVGETISGNGAGQMLNGTAEENTILLFGGNDQSDGGAGHDRIFGHAGADTLGGGAGDDTIDGGDNDDVIDGGLGDDSLIGGLGVDRVDFSASGSAVNVNLVTGAATGFGSDTLSGFENVYGSNFGDTIVGSASGDGLQGFAGNDSIHGDDGNDTLWGGAGADTLDGGNGVDWLHYGEGLTGVTVDIGLNTASGGLAAGDVISNFESLHGGRGDDSLTGSNIANALRGHYGSDSIFGLDGDDVIYGDTTIEDALDGGDSVDGGAGNDAIHGMGGGDLLIGRAGDDTLDGGTGSDAAVYLGARADYQITFSAGVYTVTDLRGGSPDGTDTVTNVETFIFADGAIAAANVADIVGTAFAEVLTGGAEANRILGLGSNDLVIAGNGNNFVLTTWGNDSIFAGTGSDTINAGNGEDEIYSGDGNDLITLGNGDDYTAAGTGADTIIAGGSGYKDIDGEDGDDTIDVALATSSSIDGGAGNDTITGGSGMDTIAGGLGDDVMDGGAGSDVINYLTAVNAVSVNLATGVATGQGADTLTGFERLNGSGYNDTLTGDGSANVIWGNSGADLIDAGGGDDTIVGSSGNDTIDGGSGSDIAMFNGNRADYGVDVFSSSIAFTDLRGGSPDGMDALTNVEVVQFADGVALVGSAGGDVITGGVASELIYGLDGADAINGGDGQDNIVGGAGGDTLDGGNGLDWLNYSYGSVGVQVSLQAGTASGGHAQGDVISNFEWLHGGGGNDTLTGSNGDNQVWGGDAADLIAGLDGNDTLYGDLNYERVSDGNDTIDGGLGNDLIGGGDGADILTGGAGNDTIDGGTGMDTVVFTGSRSDYAITFSAGVYTVTDLRGASFDGVDSVTTVENFQFADGTIAAASVADIIGTAGAEALTGGAESNRILGNGGNDTITGGGGNDYVLVTGGASQVTLGAGNDYMLVQASGTHTIDLGGGANYLGFLAGGGTVTSGSGNDTIESAGGGALSVNAGGGDDSITGGAGADTFSGGGGNDTLNGGGGSDMAVYTGAVAEYAVGYDAATQRWTITDSVGGRDGIDVLHAFETLSFSSGNVTLVSGTTGNDTFNGAAAAEIHGGGAGVDFVNFSGAAVTVNLTTNVNTGGNANGDRFIGVENIEGTVNGDSITGDAANNVLDGVGGNDTLNGGDGDDTLNGGDGDDSLSGGLGLNTLDGGDGHDTLVGGDNADTLLGGLGDDFILGYSGNDVIVSGGGVLVTDGGVGNDSFFIDATALTFGPTNIDGGPQSDSVVLSAGSALTKADIVGSLFYIETIDFSGSGVSADLTGFTAQDATAVLGNSAPSGNILTLDLDANDTFSAASSAGFTANDLGGGIYQYVDNGTSQEVARVQII